LTRIRGLQVMDFSTLTFLLFTAFSGLHVFSYVPQIRKVARDTNGASAISYSTWTMWTGANTATAFYAAINLGDIYLACVSALYAGCCLIVIVVTKLKRRVLGALQTQKGGIARSTRACSDGLPQPT
jgi:hypothetical protein